MSSDSIEQFGISSELCSSLLLLAKKLSSLALSIEEYVLLKAIVLLNPGDRLVQHFNVLLLSTLFCPLLLLCIMCDISVNRSPLYAYK